MSCFQCFHSSVDLKRQNYRSQEWLQSSRHHDKRRSNKPFVILPKVTDNDDSTIEEESTKGLPSNKRKNESKTEPLPTSVNVPENSNNSKKPKIGDSKEGIVIEKVTKYWCTKLNCSRGGLSKKDYDKLSEFGQIQNVKGDGNCGVYAAVEGLLNCLIAVTTNVKEFRKEVRDFIDTNRNEVLMNFTFSGKLLKNGTVRGKKRDDWIENDVMKKNVGGRGKVSS